MEAKKKMIVLDGKTGEGGGQILRTALTLSMMTGLAFGQAVEIFDCWQQTNVVRKSTIGNPSATSTNTW